jgi:hypothetical protein
MQPNPWSRARYAWQEGNYPLTKWIIVINIATLLAFAFRAPVLEWLAFEAPFSLSRPWTLLTYPLVSINPISLLFYGLMLWWVGGSLERSWGTRFYAIFFGLMSVITALGFQQVRSYRTERLVLYNWLPLAALMWPGAMLNPNEEIRIWGIIPILAKWPRLGRSAPQLLHLLRLRRTNESVDRYVRSHRLRCCVRLGAHARLARHPPLLVNARPPTKDQKEESAARRRFQLARLEPAGAHGPRTTQKTVPTLIRR